MPPTFSRGADSWGLVGVGLYGSRLPEKSYPRRRGLRSWSARWWRDEDRGHALRIEIEIDVQNCRCNQQFLRRCLPRSGSSASSSPSGHILEAFSGLSFLVLVGRDDTRVFWFFVGCCSCWIWQSCALDFTWEGEQASSISVENISAQTPTRTAGTKIGSTRNIHWGIKVQHLIKMDNTVLHYTPSNSEKTDI
jgi:hypothetical protein